MTAVDFRRMEGRSLIPEWQLAVPIREEQEELSESQEPTLFPFQRAEATRRQADRPTEAASGGCCTCYQAEVARVATRTLTVEDGAAVIQSYQSALDTTKTVTWHQGAVTLICAAGTNHAEIVIESIRNGKKLVLIAHLMGIDEITGRHL